MEFNERLMELRKQKGWSQEDLGYQINVSRQTVSKWELGETTPEMNKLSSMAELFEVSLDYLVSGEAMTSGTRRRGDYEYKSQATINGMPVIHINLGKGLKKAKGIVAIGNIATGVVAVGGLAVGVVSVGGFSIGVVSLSGFALGIVALGGLAAGYFALGGVAFGYLAVGGVALGINAIGGAAIARDIALGYNARGTIAIGDQVLGDHAILRGTNVEQTLNAFKNALKSLPDVKTWVVRIFNYAIKNG